MAIASNPSELDVLNFVWRYVINVFATNYRHGNHAKL